MAISDHELISARYFFPRRDRPRDTLEVVVDGATLACFASKRGHRRTVLHFHGNGEVAADWVELDDVFDSMGADLFLAEYRGYGGSSGVPRLAAMLEDVVALVGATGVPVEEIVVFGRSIGSIYAIEAAARYPSLAGVILESGIHDVGERLLLRVTPEELGVTHDAFDAEMKRLFDHERKLASFPGPVLVLHAERDHLVGIDHAERNAAAAPNSTLVRLPRGDHNSIMAANQAAYFASIREFLATNR